MVDFHRARLGNRARLITIDVDSTDDPTHDQQKFAFFNGYYGTWCYLPLVATLTFNSEPSQYLVAAILRPGTGAAARGVRPVRSTVDPQLAAEVNLDEAKQRLTEP